MDVTERMSVPARPPSRPVARRPASTSCARSANSRVGRDRRSPTFRFEFPEGVFSRLAVYSPMGLIAADPRADRTLVTGDER